MSDDDETEAYSRLSDPSTSHAAAERIRNTKLEAEVLAMLRMSGLWLSVIEIAEVMGIDKWSVSPRLRPLHRKGLVEVRVEPRLNSSDKIRGMQVWHAIRPKPVQLSLFEGDAA
jgi:DNA-binding MarR family transcriptional regulator